jgi:hypothetical protein
MFILKSHMTSFSLHRLFREWLALLAVLAMVLGPLSVAVSRGLSAQERVNIAAGLTSLPICIPGDETGGLAAKTSVDCDHCLPSSGSDKITIILPENALTFEAKLFPADTEPSALLQQLRLPPATGPPILI